MKKEKEKCKISLSKDCKGISFVRCKGQTYGGWGKVIYDVP